MPIYYEDARLTVTEQDGRYNIFDRKFERETHKNVSKEWADDFIHRVINKRRKPLKKQITTIITTIILTFIVVQNAALTTVSVQPVSGGYAVELFGAVTIVK